MKILFMGTPDFAVPCIKILKENGHEICAVVTQSDKPKGRGHKLVAPPVKVFALENNIPVYQPESIRNGELESVLNELSPELIVVVAYGKILPEYILNFPKYGCINVHASLLPRYRGAAPIQWAVINGEKETGVTTMYMEKGLDTGDMIDKSVTEIGERETYGQLHDRLSVMGAELLIKTVSSIEAGNAKREKQDDSMSDYAPMISRQTGLIDWNKSAQEIVNLIRGCNPYPMAYTTYNGEVLKIISAVVGNECDGKCGSIKIADKKLVVVCGDGKCIVADEIQPTGSKRMSVASYLNGHTIDESVMLV